MFNQGAPGILTLYSTHNSVKAKILGNSHTRLNPVTEGTIANYTEQ